MAAGGPAGLSCHCTNKSKLESCGKGGGGLRGNREWNGDCSIEMDIRNRGEEKMAGEETGNG